VTSCNEPRKYDDSDLEQRNTTTNENKNNEGEFSETEWDDVEPSKYVDWANGNSYSYDYTESIETTDSLGNSIIYTVYKRNRPNESSINCDMKACRWCSKSIPASDYTLYEHPDISFLREGGNPLSLLSIVLDLLNFKTYIDFENHKVRTEWKLSCNYPGPNGFCSLKCESEYNNR